MVSPSAPSEGSSMTATGPSGTKGNLSGPYDALFHAICPQHPDKPRLNVPPPVSRSATRKITPSRPVFEDFETAHSSITSGSTSNLSKIPSKKSSKLKLGLLERGDPLSRRNRKSFGKQNKFESAGDVLGRPLSARVQHSGPLSEFDFDISGSKPVPTLSPKIDPSSRRSKKSDSDKQTTSSPFFGSLKKVLLGKSSPTSKSSKSPVSTSSTWARDSIQLATVPWKVGHCEKSEVECDRSVSQVPSELDSIGQAITGSSSKFDDPFVVQLGQSTAVVPEEDIRNGSHSDHRLPEDSECYFDHCAGSNSGSYPHGKDSFTYLEAMGDSHGRGSLNRATSSMKEGSTVDNIVKQYANNHRLWDINLESDDEQSDGDDTSLRQTEARIRAHDGFRQNVSQPDDGIANSQLDHPRDFVAAQISEQICAMKLIDSSGQAPSEALPQIPSPTSHRVLQSSSEGLGQISSYGDTRNLLEITQRSQLIPFVDDPNSLGAKLGPQLTQKANQIVDCNPYHGDVPYNRSITSFSTNNSSLVSLPIHDNILESLISNSCEDQVIAPRLALERDVSRALRRVSAFSNHSQETSAQDHGDGGFQSSTDSSGLLSFINKDGQRLLKVQRSNHKGFYHESAIHQTWLDSQRLERVKIPVNCHPGVSLPFHTQQPTLLAEDGSDLMDLSRRDEDINDWETLPESREPSGAVKNLHASIGNVNCAGSSVANTSDDGDISPLMYQYDDFSSTERIVQHPAHIDYSHDYRRREIKDGNFPILLPSYQQHTVNGFPANSYRSLSQFQQVSTTFHYQHPTPLSRDHKNPFRSPPPESMIVGDGSDETSDRNFIGEAVPNLALDNYSSQVLKRERDDVDRWMNEFGDTGPVVQPGNNMGAADSASCSSSKSCSRSRTVGGRLADTSFSTTGAPVTGEQQAGFSRAIGTNKPSTVTHENAPFIKRPPGAFYQGIRSRPDPRGKGFSLDRQLATKSPQSQASYSYPTNQIRPLSLLETHPLKAGTERDDHLVEGIRQDNFFYRSPLAPVKSRNWRSLYTREQLSLIRNAAKDDGIYEIESQRSQSSRPKYDEDIKANGSWKRLPWSPHMFAWPRNNSSINTGLEIQKTKISNIVFGLCCLFPPMLVLFGFGYMDNMMLWITEGEISAFSKSHKRAALRFVCFFIVAILIVITIAVAVMVSKHV